MIEVYYLRIEPKKVRMFVPNIVHYCHSRSKLLAHEHTNTSAHTTLEGLIGYKLNFSLLFPVSSCHSLPLSFQLFVLFISRFCIILFHSLLLVKTI